MNRQQILQSLHDQPTVEVLVVGGGINGIGTFRDLALQGIEVLLIERGDFCSGASAASSHMAHGGIRYLENGEFRLVREAVQERNRLLRNAPHLVQPLPTTIPIFKWFSGLFNAPLKFLNLLDRPAERGALVIKIGLLLYDALTGHRHAVPRHNLLNRNASLKRWPNLSPGVICTATYHDGAIRCPERLAIELVADGETAGPHARALNYCSLIAFKGNEVTVRDELTHTILKIRPRVIINATGPWIDQANQLLGLHTHYISGTKGSHLVIDHPELRRAIGDHEFFFENKDGRIVLIFPLEDKVLIGTSDIPIQNPDEAHCSEEEVAYFLELVARVFPDIKVARRDIVFRFSGTRPLAYSHAKTTGQITRDHRIQIDHIGGLPVYSLVGGKWTSYRAFSEQTSDKILRLLGRKRQKDTCNLPIGGGRGFSNAPEKQQQYLQGLSAWTGLPVERLEVLFQRYGTLSERMAMFITKEADHLLDSLPDYSVREIDFLTQYEHIIHLDDLILRRSMLAILGLLTHTRLEELAEVLGKILGWSKRERKVELTRALKILSDRHDVEITS